MTQNSPIREFDFTLLLTGINELTPNIMDALFEAGCDDGTVSMRSGRAFITFSRQAPSMKDAIVSAIGNVRNANIGADVLRVDDCNLVAQADIARRINRSRQLVHQYMTGERGPGGFPSPVCGIVDNYPLWRWCEVSYWLWQNNMVKEEVRRDAEEIDLINNVLDLIRQRALNPERAIEVINSLSPQICH